MTWPTTSRHERGYGAEWVKLRARILARDGHRCHCPDCKGGAPGGRLTAATEVDHIKPKAQGGTDDPSNLRAVNRDCHQRLTMAQQGHRPRTQFGLDGAPIGPHHWNETPGGADFPQSDKP